MFYITVTVSFDLFVSCVITFGACYISIPTDFCTSRSLCFMFYIAVTVSRDFIVSRVTTILTSLISIPTNFCTSRSFRIVLNDSMIILVNLDNLCSYCSTSSTCVSHNTCAYASSRSCYNAFSLNVVTGLAERLFAILSITNIVVIFINVIECVYLFLICVSFVVLTCVSHNAISSAGRIGSNYAIIPIVTDSRDFLCVSMSSIILTSVSHNAITLTGSVSSYFGFI